MLTKMLKVMSMCQVDAVKTWRSGGTGVASRILNLDTKWRWIVSFAPPPLYPRGKISRCHFGRRLCGSQSRSATAGNRTPVVQSAA